MSIIEAVLDHLIDTEGGLSNVVGDRGGLTKYGITKPFYARIKGIKVSQVKDENIINLTVEGAKDLYRKYWKICKVDYLPVAVQHIYFDMCVNHGDTNGAKILQRALSDLKLNPGIDGKVGPLTIKKASLAGPEFLAAILARRTMFYDAIVAKDPSQKKFYKGWINNRVKWFDKNSLTAITEAKIIVKDSVSLIDKIKGLFKKGESI